MLKSLEIAREIVALRKDIDSMRANKNVIPNEVVDKLEKLLGDYSAQLEKENKDKQVRKGVVNTMTMNKKSMKNKIFLSMLMNKDYTDEMKASGIDLPKYVDTLGANGQVGANNARGGYLVDSEFLELDVYGGEVPVIPARLISVSLPTGKMPYVNLDQAKDNTFLPTFDELDAAQEKHGTFGQLEYATVDRVGLIPLSYRVINDADADIVGVVGELLTVHAQYQRNADIVNAVNGIPSIATEYAGTGKTFEDKEAIKALIKAVRGKLTGANRRNAKIVMCDSDFAKLACATNAQGDFYLRPMASDPARFQIDGVEVIAVDDRHFTNDSTVGGYALVGNWDRVAYIARQQLEISSDYSAGFTRDALMVKGVLRACAKVLENGAFVKVCEGASA